MSDRPKLPREARAWPKCPRCRSTDTTGRGEPPGPVDAVCRGCGHTWTVCGARARNGLTICGLRPVEGGPGRCRHHGGLSPTPAGIWRGRRTRHLPAALAERVEEALTDPELVSVREDLALAEALIVGQAAGLGVREHAELWEEAVEAYRSVPAGAVDGEHAAAWRRLGDVLENGRGDAERIRTILRIGEHKRRLAETEVKRLAALQQFIPAEQVNALIGAVVAIVREVVTDESQRRSVARRLAALGDRPDR